MASHARTGALVLRGGTVLDGVENAPMQRDVVISEGWIFAVEHWGSFGKEAIEIDCRGLVVTPGFIDAHSHADFTLPTTPTAAVLHRQGVTTVVTGNCGFSPFPANPLRCGEPPAAGRFFNADLTCCWKDLPGFRSGIERTRTGVNVVPLVGHSAARTAVLGEGGGVADERQEAQIVELVLGALHDGAAGVSLGLAYQEARDASPRELSEIARVTAAAGRVLSVHVRDERNRCVEAVREALSLGRRHRVALHISHLKAMGKENWGSTYSTLSAIDEARSSGDDVTTDMYPYTAGATTLAAALPGWATGGGGTGIRRLLRDPSARARLAVELDAGNGYIALDEIAFSRLSRRWESLSGRQLVEAARSMGMSPAALLMDVLAAEGDQASMIVHAMASEDVARVLAHPASMIGSDGWVLDAVPGAHPRNYATFIRTLVSAKGSDRQLTDAVRRQTRAVAERFAILDRGVVAPGYRADVVVLDLDELDEGGGFDDPLAPPRGVRHVLVNGVPVFPELPAALPGRFITASSHGWKGPHA